MKRTISMILRILLTVGVILTLFAAIHTINNSSAKEPMDIERAQDAGDGWYIIRDGYRENIRLPADIPTDTGTLTVYREFSAEELSKGILLLANKRQSMRVFCEGEEIFSLGNVDDGPRTSVNEYGIIHLPSSERATVISTEFSGCRDGICSIDMPVLCTPLEALVHMQSLDSSDAVLMIVLIILLIFLALFILVMFFKRIYNASICSLLAMLALTGVWLGSGMWSVTLLPLSDEFICYLNYTSLMFLPLPMGLCAYFSTLKHKSPVLLGLMGLCTLNVVIQQLLLLTDSLGPYDMLVFSHAAVLATVICSLCVTIKDYFLDKTSIGLVKVLTFTIPVLMAVAVLAVFWLVDGVLYNEIFVVGALIFSVMLIFVGGFTFVQNIYRSHQLQAEVEIYQKLSMKDGLTGLKNLRAFNDTMDRIQGNAPGDALLFFMDVNGLKTANDQCGHQKGDELLVGAAECLKSVFGEENCYRLGGDEFAVVVEDPEISSKEYLRRFDEKVGEVNEGRNIRLSIARGCDRLLGPDGIRRTISLWKSNADREMYADKLCSRISEDGADNYKIIQENMDELTGILNIEGFRKNAVYTICKSPESGFALWYCDIKRFKLFNDSFGYKMGDELLRYYSRAVLDLLYPGESCGRVANDTIVVMTKRTSEEELEEFFKSLTEKVNGFFAELDLSYQVELSAGVYILNDQDMYSHDVNQMMDFANVAQKSVKSRIGSNFARYDSDMWESQRREQFIDLSLDAAIKNGEIQVWLQPQFNYVSGRIVGAEALCRWKHGTLGWIRPDEFIPCLERSNQISKLDRYVWEEVCRMLSDWRKRKDLACISVAVNVSRQEIIDSNGFARLESLIKTYDLPKSAVRIEISERGYMEHPEELVSFTDMMHNNGYTVEMDDFGSGFSSLNMLKDVKVDVLKMDMRFLQGDAQQERGSKIIKSVALMAKDLNIPVMVEGVETEEQAIFLSSIGCELMQGYLFARPMPAKEFEAMLKEEKKKITSLSKSDETGDVVIPYDNGAAVYILQSAEYCLDSDNRIVRIDGEFTNLTGYTWEDVLSLKLNQRDLIPPKDSAVYWNLVKSISAEEKEVRLKHGLVRKDGSIITVYCNGTHIIDPLSGEKRSRIKIQKAADE